ncbi:MAG: radical SAM protein [Candidatus Hodarchaeales archaeon]
MSKVMFIRNHSIHGESRLAQRFNHYLGVLKGEKTVKYLIAKKTPIEEYDLSALSIKDLWKIHVEARERVNRFEKERNSVKLRYEDIPTPKTSFLDLKAKIAEIILKECHFCERRCGVNRTEEKLGFCRLPAKAIVSSAFLHMGEEPPLVPSGTIFFVGCTFKCVFCQNWTISQKWGDISSIREGDFVSPKSLSMIMRKLAIRGAKNINWVGGDPTPNIFAIIESLKHFQMNTIQLWNSNMYLSKEAMELLIDIIDFWLPDLKFRCDKFAYEMTHAKNYWKYVTRNIKFAYDYGSKEMIVRHLVMPTRVQEDTIPILDWCSKNIPDSYVNIMGQWRPENKIKNNERFKSLDRRITSHELVQARNYADQLQIHWREVS